MDAQLRLIIFFSVIAVLIFWEWRVPFRKLKSRRDRWQTNLTLQVLNIFIQRFVVGAVAVGFAYQTHAQGAGLLGLVEWPTWLEGVMAWVILDWAIWLQHWVTHKVPLFWRFHRVHHLDHEMDWTTGARFHPIEILASLGYKIGLIYAIGASPAAVLIFETILNSAALFNHSNIRLPKGLEPGLRWLVVTPEMHRIHHSNIRQETDSNYGFSVSIWDRVFGTYCDRSSKKDRMTFGIVGIKAQYRNLLTILLNPFRQM